MRTITLEISRVVIYDIPRNGVHVGLCVACGAKGLLLQGMYGYPSTTSETSELRHEVKCPVNRHLNRDGKLKQLSLRARDVERRKGLSEFSFYDESLEVGFAQVRHSQSSGEGVPSECGSHVYYEVHEQFRGQGYARELLSLLIPQAWKVVFGPALVITCEEGNIASRRTIEACGAKFRDSWPLKPEGRMLRYELRRE